MTDKPTFKPGDVVELNSGGPQMTVSLVEPALNSCTCDWFEGSKPHTKQFAIDSLKKVEA